VACDLRVNTGKSATDQAKRLVLAIRMGVKISRCSYWRLVPNLRVRPLGRSKLIVLSTSSIRAPHPTLGSSSSPDKAMLESGGRSMLLVCRICS